MEASGESEKTSNPLKGVVFGVWRILETKNTNVYLDVNITQS